MHLHMQRLDVVGACRKQQRNSSSSRWHHTQVGVCEVWMLLLAATHSAGLFLVHARQ
jgi:hypothetical protein